MNYTARDTTAVLLAAGHGKRMLPLTENMPKPLLKVGDRSLIEHHLHNLQQQGFEKIVVNLAYHGEQIREFIGDGSGYGLTVNYSDESATGALETAGGLLHALPLVNSDPFIVVNADIWTDYPFSRLLRALPCTARLVMVKNPAHNHTGDFSFANDSALLQQIPAGECGYTFSGIGLYHKVMLAGLPAGRQPLAPILRRLITQQQIEGEVYDGEWLDIGTPERLAQLNHRISQLPGTA